jgi:hypothetical protein
MMTLSMFADTIHFIASTAGFIWDTNAVIKASSSGGGGGVKDAIDWPGRPMRPSIGRNSFS